MFGCYNWKSGLLRGDGGVQPRTVTFLQFVLPVLLQDTIDTFLVGRQNYSTDYHRRSIVNNYYAINETFDRTSSYMNNFKVSTLDLLATLLKERISLSQFHAQTFLECRSLNVAGDDDVVPIHHARDRIR